LGTAWRQVTTVAVDAEPQHNADPKQSTRRAWQQQPPIRLVCTAAGLRNVGVFG
jgi:hypothetical protein